MKIGIWKFRIVISLVLATFVLGNLSVLSFAANLDPPAEDPGLDDILNPPADPGWDDYVEDQAEADKAKKIEDQKAADEEAAIEKGTILPGTDLPVSSCKIVMAQVSLQTDLAKKRFQRELLDTAKDAQFPYSASTILACAIKTGDIRLWMVPYYIRYMLEFVIGISGLIAVGGIIVGGYLYLFAGVSEDKDRGKKAILYGVIGLIMTLIAWAFVNIVITIVT